MQATQKYRIFFSTSGAMYDVMGVVVYHANDGIFEFNFNLAPEFKKEFDQYTGEFLTIGQRMVNFRVKDSHYDLLGLQYRAYGYYLV